MNRVFFIVDFSELSPMIRSSRYLFVTVAMVNWWLFIFHSSVERLNSDNLRFAKDDISLGLTWERCYLMSELYENWESFANIRLILAKARNGTNLRKPTMDNKYAIILIGGKSLIKHRQRIAIAWVIRELAHETLREETRETSREEDRWSRSVLSKRWRLMTFENYSMLRN